MSVDPYDFIEDGVSSECCGASVANGRCVECGEPCETFPDDEPEEENDD